MRRDERGIALLEVLIALVVLTSVGTGLVAALAAAMRSEHQLRREEALVLAAERVLAAMALLGRADLDRRLGRHPAGEFVVEVQRPERTLYRIAVRESQAPEIEALVTVVYRPEALSP